VSEPQDGWEREEREALAEVEGQLAAVRERHRHDPPLGQLRAAQADALPTDLQRDVEEHLGVSPWSRALLAGVDRDDAPLDADASARLLARIQREAARPAVDARARWWWPALASVAFGAAAIVAWVVVGGRDGAAPSTSPSTDVASTPAAATPAAPLSTPTPPFLLAFAAPDVRVSLGALTWRGTAGNNTLLADLKPALDAYRQGDYASADRLFTALAPTYPKAIEVLFYQGVTRLLLDDAKGAIAALDAAEGVGDATFAADVRWYRAVAEQRAGNAADARARLDLLCREGGAAAARACAARNELDAALAAVKP
jgi:TolA-binding protein